MNTTFSTYEQDAIDTMNSLGAKMDVKFLRNGKHFNDDKETRDIYEITLTNRDGRKYTFEFGQSINNSGFYYTVGKKKNELDRKYLEKDYFKGKPLGLIGTIKMRDHSFTPSVPSDKIHYPVAPSVYSVLACLQKYEVGTFEDFCSEFGYDLDSRKAEKTYKAVCDEYTNVCRLFSDSEIELLSEIQ